MLRFSVIHQMPNGDTFHFSSHHNEFKARIRIKELKSKYKNHQDQFEKWFDPKKLEIRDNFKIGYAIP